MNVIEKIKETQQAGALICPRCGRMSMDKVLLQPGCGCLCLPGLRYG